MAVNQYFYDPTIGSYRNAQGGYTYNPDANRLTNPTDYATGVDGFPQRINPNLVATPSTAQAFATALGGTVVADPTFAWLSSTAPLTAIRLSNGQVVNAGAIAAVLGNEAAFPGSTTKSGEIAKLFGVAYDPNNLIADRLFASVGAHTTGPVTPPPTDPVPPVNSGGGGGGPFGPSGWVDPVRSPVYSGRGGDNPIDPRGGLVTGSPRGEVTPAPARGGLVTAPPIRSTVAPISNDFFGRVLAAAKPNAPTTDHVPMAAPAARNYSFGIAFPEQRISPPSPRRGFFDSLFSAFK